MLWCGAFPWWLFYLTRGSVQPWTWTDCKLGVFLFFFSAHFSSALLIIMSVEKTFVLYFPLKTKIFCTVKTAKRVCLFTTVIFVAYELQWFIIYDARTQNGVQNCIYVRIPPGHQNIVLRINSVFYSFAPFTLMIVANGAIIYKFLMAKLKSIRNSSDVTNQALTTSAKKGTAMLITVSLTFIILTGPRAVILAMGDNPPPIERVVLNVMQYLNHSINGVLYCIVGSRFKRELLKVLPCCKYASSIKTGRHLSRNSTMSTEPGTTNPSMTNISAIDSSI